MKGNSSKSKNRSDVTSQNEARPERAQRRERSEGRAADMQDCIRSGNFSKSLSPNGLGPHISNLHNTYQRINNVFMGLKDEKDIARDFLKMKGKVQNAVVELINKETGELISVPNGSRWNTESRYFGRLKAKLFKEIEGLRYGRMLTLSFDPELVKSHLPGWWPWGVQEFLIVFGNIYISRFLKRYRTFWERQGKKWHFIASVMEIQPGTGNVHYHLVFRGAWLGDAKTLMGFWEGSDQPAGLEISKKKSARGAIRYIGKYETKLESLRNEDKWSHLHKFIWYFRVRIYNLRHHKSEPIEPIKSGKYEYQHKKHPADVLERMRKIEAGTWTEADEERFQNGPEPIGENKWTGNLRDDLKIISKMPVLYPNQAKRNE